MAITDEGSGNGFYMPVAPAYAGNGNSGFGFGGDWAWILLLLVLFGGWNNNGYGGGFGGGDLYPWMNNSQHISDGFRDQMLNTTITSISDKLFAPDSIRLKSLPMPDRWLTCSRCSRSSLPFSNAAAKTELRQQT